MTELTNGVVHPNGAGEPRFAGHVRPTDIINEMQDAYLDYAMSVIVARALPDVRDGLKPVHRRILYAMWHDLGLTHDKPHKKSARIVGEVLGKYHPHGDTAVYDAMVRMAQEFSLRYPLVDGQGNFGSVDGDNAAAMRYTEARLADLSNLMLNDLEKETVNWHGNFDNTLLEPDVLPAALPNLLINGSSGIAVGMSTNVPPHNLGEVVDALAYLIDHYAAVDDITVEQLMQFIQGPDFPTGGILYRYRDDAKAEENADAIAQGYSLGKSRLVIQAKAHFEEMSRGRMRIVITELPYQTNKQTLLERIADLVRDEKIVGITDLRDESDRTGMRVTIELTRNVDPKDILSDLFKYTPLQQTFGMQMLALVDGQPRTLPIKRMLQLFVQHREEIIRRRSEFDLKRARERAHILEGLLRALDILDEVIQTIRNSQRVETARANLVKNFDFSEIQAQAILDMQLRRLAALERKRLQDEYKAIKDRIKYLEDLLEHPEKILALIKEELLLLKEKYGDARRTQIVDRTKGTLTTTDLLPDQQVWVAVGADGELRRQDVTKLTPSILRQISKGSEVALLTANTRDYLYVFTKDGRCSRVAIHEIPHDGNKKHLTELCKLGRRDTVTAALVLPRVSNGDAPTHLFFATELGIVKRITLSDFLAAAATDPLVMGVEDKDRLGWAFTTRGDQEVLLVSAEGQAIRLDENEVRSMGLTAGGVAGMKLKKGLQLVYATAINRAFDAQSEVLTMTAQGYAKRSPLSDYPTQGRNGGGVVTHKPTARTGNVTAALLVNEMSAEDMIIPLTRKGSPKPMPLTEIPIMGRGVQGKLVLEVSGSDTIAAVKQIVDTTLLPGPGGRTPDSNPDGEKGNPPATIKPVKATPVPATNGASKTPVTAKTTVATKPQLELKKVVASKPDQAQPPARSKADKVVESTAPVAVVEAAPAARQRGNRSVPSTIDAKAQTDGKAATLKSVSLAEPLRSTTANAAAPTPPVEPKVEKPNRSEQTPVAPATPASGKRSEPAPKLEPMPTKPARNRVADEPKTVADATTPRTSRTTAAAPVAASEPSRTKMVDPTPVAPAPVTRSPVKAAQAKPEPVKVTAMPTQPGLFASEAEPAPSAARTRQAKKVEAVVSVPLGQAGSQTGRGKKTKEISRSNRS